MERHIREFEQENSFLKSGGVFKGRCNT